MLRDRLASNWVYGGALAAPILLCAVPVLDTDGVGRLTWLALPAYMIHQLEEHDADRFRLFMNQVLGPERHGLTVMDVFTINILGVWLPLALIFLAGQYLSPGWSAWAGWLLVVNGLLHGIQAIAMGRRNPGLVTGLFVFLPLGGALLALSRGNAPALWWSGLAAALLLHMAIARHATRKVSEVPAR